MKKGLKLFVWEDVLSDWTSGIAFALAHNEEEALKLRARQLGESVDETKNRQWQKPLIYEDPVGYAIYGGS